MIAFIRLRKDPRRFLFMRYSLVKWTCGPRAGLLCPRFAFDTVHILNAEEIGQELGGN